MSVGWLNLNLTKWGVSISCTKAIVAYCVYFSDISQLADRTMTLSELDVSKTTGKKKSEELGPTSEAVTTDKKKKKKPAQGKGNSNQ